MTEEIPKRPGRGVQPKSLKECPQCHEKKAPRTGFTRGAINCKVCAAKNREKKKLEKLEERRQAALARKRAAKKIWDKKRAEQAKKETAAARKATNNLKWSLKNRKLPKVKEIEAEADAMEKAAASVEAEAQKKEEIAEQMELTRGELVRRELARRQLARNHLIPYIHRFHAGYMAGWVHKDIAIRLERFSEQVARGESPRLMLQMPPRTGKSAEASVYFPSWHLGKYPHHEIMLCSYSASLAMNFSRKARGILREPDYRMLFPKTLLDPDNQNAEGWRTTKGGGFMPVGVGGPATGNGAHILLIDDPVKNSEEAESPTVRQSIKDWYSSTAYTRLAPGGGVLVIQTRWHEDDLSGWLEDQMNRGDGDKFEIVRYPALAMEDERFRLKGQALHPERYDRKALLRIKKAVGPRVWDALYQQHPTSEEGGYFSSDMIQYYEGAGGKHDPALPDRLTYYTAWDFAIGKKERNDFTVGITVGLDDEDNMWVVGLTRGRFGTFEMAEAILDNWVRYEDRLVGMEKGHISMALGPYLEQRIKERRLYGFPMHELPPGRRDKELRARPLQGRMRQGKVFFPRHASWMEDLLKELMGFPFSKHDDIVDALAWIGLMLQDMDRPQAEKQEKKEKKSWKEKLKKHMLNQRTNGRRRSHMVS